MRIGLLIEAYRRLNKISQTDLARDIGVSKSTLCRVEKREAVDGETLVKIIHWITAKGEL